MPRTIRLKPKRPTLRVALAFHTVQPHLERITRGILDYASSVGGWQVELNPEGIPVTLESLEGWDGDGILAMLETEEQLDLAKRLQLPVVNLSARLETTHFPSVLSDNWTIGKLAAEHFLERGFRRCAFYGLENVFYSQERLRGFRDTIASSGGSVETLITHSNLTGKRPWDWDRDALEKWLSKLGSHVGLMAVHDYRAQLVLATSRRLGIDVPGQIAVLGVNDDPVACNGSSPSLSSVPQDGTAIGWQAAATLSRWIETGKPPASPSPIQPLFISERRSTQMFGAEDPRLRHAMEQIESQLSRSFGIEQIAEAMGISRRWLEQLFLKNLSLSPHAYIVQRRLRLVRLIRETMPSIKASELARKAGFPSTRSLNTALQLSQRI